METPYEPAFQVDHAFLESVESEIARAIQHAAELDAGLAELLIERNDAWLDAFDRLNANLAGWQGRLAALTEQTRQTESDLNEQESTLRTWIQTMGVASTRLAQASEPSAA